MFESDDDEEFDPDEFDIESFRGAVTFAESKMNEKKMTFGIKKASSSENGKPLLFTTTNEWLSARFIGIFARTAKEWKTRAGAERAAKRRGGEVFTITDTMNYS